MISTTNAACLESNYSSTQNLTVKDYLYQIKEISLLWVNEQITRSEFVTLITSIKDEVSRDFWNNLVETSRLYKRLDPEVQRLNKLLQFFEINIFSDFIDNAEEAVVDYITRGKVTLTVAVAAIKDSLDTGIKLSITRLKELAQALKQPRVKAFVEPTTKECTVTLDSVEEVNYFTTVQKKCTEVGVSTIELVKVGFDAVGLPTTRDEFAKIDSKKIEDLAKGEITTPTDETTPEEVNDTKDSTTSVTVEVNEKETNSSNILSVSLQANSEKTTETELDFSFLDEPETSMLAASNGIPLPYIHNWVTGEDRTHPVKKLTMLAAN